jgi:hypothetical protein
LHQHPEALADWNLALALDTGEFRFAVRAGSAVTRARLGEHAPAMAEAADLAKAPKLSGKALYNLARVFALAAGAARQDGRLAAVDREKLAADYAPRAVELLRRAHKAGHFKAPEPLQSLKQDSDFEPLRSDAGFKGLLAEMEAAGDKAGS